MDKNSAFGELMEKGQQAASGTVKNVAGDIGNSVAGQLGLKNETNSNNSQNPQQVQDQAGSSVKPPSEALPSASPENELTEEMVQDFYAPSENIPQNIASEEQERLETAQKLTALRKQLHDEVYYQPLTNPKREDEERPAERVERQEREEMQDLQKKEAEKPPPIAVQRAQTTIEMNRGVSG